MYTDVQWSTELWSAKVVFFKPEASVHLSLELWKKNGCVFVFTIREVLFGALNKVKYVDFWAA